MKITQSLFLKRLLNFCPFSTVLGTICIIIFVIFFMWNFCIEELFDETQESFEIERGKKCFKIPDDLSVNHIDFLEDILTSEIQPDQRRTIFLHETSCFKNGVIDMTAR